MHLITSSFMTAAVALMVISALAQLFYYFRSKHKANVTDVDKQLWQLRLFSAFLGALLFLAMLYLPGAARFSVDKLPTGTEASLQTLLENEQRIATDLDQLREVLNVTFMVSAIYLFGISACIARIWAVKQKRAAADDPEVKKPLGLEI